MSDFIEIRWHGRGGQGTVTAAKALADAALCGGQYVQAFPEYGPERMGAPLKAYNRLSKMPITIYAPVTNPDIVAVVDSSLIGMIDIAEGAKDNTIFIINTSLEPEKIKEKLGLKDHKLYTVDASTIAMETIGKEIPNIPILGAIAKVTDLIPLDILKKEIEKTFLKKFGTKMVEANINALKRGYEEVK